jgi:hypothetical protein
MNLDEPVWDVTVGSAATRALWYDPTAFRRTDCNIAAHPELCHYGNAAPDALISPGLHTLDLSLAKNSAIHAIGGRGRLQSRGWRMDFGGPAPASSILQSGPGRALRREGIRRLRRSVAS